MNDTEFRELFRQTEFSAEAAEGRKEALLAEILSHSGGAEQTFSGFERFLFTRPLQAAGIASLAITGALWGIFGPAFPALVRGLIG